MNGGALPDVKMSPLPSAAAGPELSLIIPVYRNAEAIDDLTRALVDLVDRVSASMEIIFVVDGSPDDSGQRLVDARKNLRCASTIIFHSRNFGSFSAIRTGLEFASGKYFAVMAADLQEPMDLIVDFLRVLQRGDADVVFGLRIGRDEPFLRKLTSNVFWMIYRRLVLPDIPKGGVDVFACNRAVRDAVLSILEPNSSLVAQLFWVGFRRAFVPYARKKRQHGKSAWTLSRRLRYFLDSVFSFSDAPILFILWTGVTGCLLSFVLGFVTLVARLAGYIEVPGYATLLIVFLFFGSAILAVQGILGCYLWRAFENTKRRPLRIVSGIVRDLPD